MRKNSIECGLPFLDGFNIEIAVCSLKGDANTSQCYDPAYQFTRNLGAVPYSLVNCLDMRQFWDTCVIRKLGLLYPDLQAAFSTVVGSYLGQGAT